MNDHTIRDMLARGMRILANEVAPDNRGHVSYRPRGENRVYIVGRLHVLGRTLLSTTYDDIVAIDLDGNQLDGRFPPPSENSMHRAIYRARDDVQAVVHVHPPKCIVFSIVAQPLVPLGINPSTIALFRHGSPPLFDNPGLIETDEVAGQMAQALGPHKAVLLRGHGVAVVGRSIEDAVVTTIQLERLARLQYEAATIGTLRPVEPMRDHNRQPREQSEMSDPAWQSWAYYEEQLNQGRNPGTRI